jgi:hypothetical protein
MENLKKLLLSLEGKSFEDIKNNCEFDIKEKGNLYMLSFNDKNDLNDDLVREVNGIILEKDTNKLIHYSFSKAYDGITKEDGDDYYSKPIDKFRAEILIEGTMIKIFYYDDEWNIATSRNIDAVYSHWGSEKSFKELFLETCALEEMSFSFDLLDKNCCYSYILQHPEITIGYDITIPWIVPFNKVNTSTFEEESYMSYYSVNYPIDQLLSELSYNKNFMIITDDNKRIKLISKEYKYAKELLNNTPSIKWAYIEAIKSDTSDEFRSFFPSKMDIFDYVEDRLYSVVKELHDIYFEKFIKRVQREEHNPRYGKTLYQLHSRYKKTLEKTTKDVIYNHLLNLKTKTITWILDL